MVLAQLLCPLSTAPSSSLALAPEWSYGTLNRLTARLTAGLQIKGFKKGDLLALRSFNHWQTICLLFAAWRLSLTILLLPPRLPSALEQKIFFELKPNTLDNLDSLFIEKECTQHELDRDFPALLLLTSGSSGPPKIASFSLSQLFESAATVARALFAQPQDRWLLSLPLHHVGGLGVLLRALYSEGTIVFQDKNLPFIDRIFSAKARFASLVPTQLHRLIHEERGSLPTHFLIGGAPLSETLFERAQAQNLYLSLTYGLTEMSSTVLLCSAPIWSNQLPYLGHPLPHRELSIAPDSEIFVRGAPLFNGYYDSIRTPQTWFATGDLGIFHEQHGYAILGRKDFQFTSGGENIQPEEIEAALLAHPLVECAVVVPLSDEEFGARPAAFIQTNLSQEKLIQHLELYLPKYKIPVAFASLYLAREKLACNEKHLSATDKDRLREIAVDQSMSIPTEHSTIEEELKPNRRQLIALINEINPFISKASSS